MHFYAIIRYLANVLHRYYSKPFTWKKNWLMAFHLYFSSESQILIRTFFKGLCRHQRKWKQSGISGMHSPMEGRQHLLLSGSHQSAPRKPLRLRGQVQVLCLLHHPPGIEIDLCVIVIPWGVIFQSMYFSGLPHLAVGRCTVHLAFSQRGG